MWPFKYDSLGWPRHKRPATVLEAVALCKTPEEQIWRLSLECSLLMARCRKLEALLAAREGGGGRTPITRKDEVPWNL